jgi:hypothetical protein
MGTLQNTTLSQDLSGLLNIILTDASNLANTVPDPLAQLGAFGSYPFLTAINDQVDIPFCGKPNFC